MDWIKCNEKLPNPFEPVWVYWRNDHIAIGYHMGGDFEDEDGWYSMEDEKCRWATCWMPIKRPKPPIKE